MAFKANIRQPQFSKSSSNSNFTQNTSDRIVTVDSYDAAKGYMYATDDKNQKQYEIYVTPSEVLRTNEAIKNKGDNTAGYAWMGHSIDEKMEKAIPAGSKVVLIRSKVISNDKTRNVSVVETHRIGGVPSPEADKTFQGILTMTYRPDGDMERISRVQHWDTKAVDIEDTDALQALKEKIDNARKNYGTKIGEFNVTEPTIGIQFRALIKTDREYAFAEEGKTAVYEMIDSSIPFDWIPGDLDENGKEIKSQAHVLTGDEMLQFAEMYADHIAGTPEFADKLSDMKVEVAYYHVYPASNNDFLILVRGDEKKDKHADKNPLYQLSHRRSFLDIAQTDEIMGRNAAVNGIIQISGNPLKKVNGKPVEIPSYWVNKIHANNTRGHVHSFIRTSDGYKVEPHENLKLIKTEQQIANAANYANNSAPAQRQSAPVATPVAQAAPMKVEVESTDFDPFAADADLGVDPFDATPAPTPAAEAPKVSRFGSRFGNKESAE